MPNVTDFFFSPYSSAQTQRLRAAVRDGLAHGSRIKPLDPQPGETVTLLFSTSNQLPIEHVAVYYTTDGSEPVGTYGRATNGLTVMTELGEVSFMEETEQEIRNWRATLPTQPDGTLVRYRADGWSTAQPELHKYADNVDPISPPPSQGRLFAYHVDTWASPSWWQDSVVYQIFVDRFNAANDEPPLRSPETTTITGFFGGTLRGIIEKLDYLQLLGINCIWLSPIFESPTHHGYNASDYHTVAARYGTNGTLRQLIDEAHLRGIRVMLDFAANHTSHEHPAFVAALHDPESETYDWYAFGDKGYRSYGGVRTMPELITDNPKVQHYLFDVARYWLGSFGADALRLDYVPGPSHAFWTHFQQAIKTSFPEALTLGEITAPLAQIANYAGRIDAYMDFPLTEMLRQVFASRKRPLADLLHHLDTRRTQLPATMTRATLLDNHDMQRFLWLADGDHQRLKLAATCHMTLEGTPIIYYGTEVGLSQYADAHKENAYARAPMIWDERQNTQLLAHYRALIALRHSQSALREGITIPLPVQVADEENATQIGAYMRLSATQVIVIVLNNSFTSVTVHIPLTETLVTQRITIDDTHLRSLLPLTVQQQPLQNGMLTLILQPLDAMILESGGNNDDDKTTSS